MVSSFSDRNSHSCFFSCADLFELRCIKVWVTNNPITAADTDHCIDCSGRRIRVERLFASQADQEIQCISFKYASWFYMGILAFSGLPHRNGGSLANELPGVFAVGYTRNVFYQLDLLLYQKRTHFHTGSYKCQCGV